MFLKKPTWRLFWTKFDGSGNLSDRYAEQYTAVAARGRHLVPSVDYSCGYIRTAALT